MRALLDGVCDVLRDVGDLDFGRGERIRIGAPAGVFDGGRFCVRRMSACLHRGRGAAPGLRGNRRLVAFVICPRKRACFLLAISVRACQVARFLLAVSVRARKRVCPPLAISVRACQVAGFLLVGLRRANQVLAARIYGRAVPACVKPRRLHAVCLRKLEETGGKGILLEHFAGCLHVARDNEALASEKSRKYLRGSAEQLVVVNEHKVIRGGLARRLIGAQPLYDKV